nr:hypothetical protein [Candidatus Freyrarchaeum guaymaensis]
MLSCLGLGLGGGWGVYCYGSEDWAGVCFIPLCASDGWVLYFSSGACMDGGGRLSERLGADGGEMR